MQIDIGSLLRDMDLGEDMNASIRKAFPGDGMPTFNLKRRQHKYLIVGELGRTQYCYTPHRAEDGYFYTFEYVEYWRNPKMRTKKGQEEIRRRREFISKTKIAHLTKARTRKLAYKRACDRLNAALARSRKREEATV